MMSSSAPPISSGARPASVKRTLRDAWRLRRVWWFTATARTQARFVRTLLGSFWLGLSNLFSIAVLASVYSDVLSQLQTAGKLPSSLSCVVVVVCGGAGLSLQHLLQWKEQFNL